MSEIKDYLTHCYCGSSARDLTMLQCENCRRLFHIRCLKTGRPSIFEGDLFFTLICAECTESREEECTRMKLQWLPVVMLSLYNLQMTNSGNRGYFRWKEQICAYIDKNWTQFFGNSRKKTTTWHGTVAGVLSSGCPQYFQSGTQELRESGWWRLTETRPPPLEVLSSGKSGSRKQRLEMVREQTSPLKLEGLRSRAGKTSIQAAMELRAKRDTLTDPRESKRMKLSVTPTPKSATTSPVRSYCSERLSFESASTSFKDDSASRDDLHMPSSLECTPMRSNSSFDLASDLADQSSQMSFSSSKSEQWFTARDLVAGETVPDCLLKDDEEEESDLEIDPCALSPDMSALTSPMSEVKDICDPLPQMEDILAALESKSKTKPEDLQVAIRPVSSASQVDQSASFMQFKQEPFSEDNNTVPVGLVDSVLPIKPEPVSEDSNTFDSSFCSGNRASSVDSFVPPYPVTTLPSHFPSHFAVPKIEQPIMTLEQCAAPTPVVVKEEPTERDENDSSSSEDDDARSQTTEMSDSGETKVRRRGRRQKEIEKEINHSVNENSAIVENYRCVSLSLYEEKQLVKSLNNVVENNGEAMTHDLRRLRRKLLVRQVKREHGQGLFDIDSYMNKVCGCEQTPHRVDQEAVQDLMSTNMLGSAMSGPGFRILDRFQSNHQAYYQRQSVSFLNRLVGTEDEQLTSIKSPYTARVLKPFIRRDYKSRSLKLKLLQEIKAYKHRNDSSWQPPPTPPIDYCYVRPQHIPSVNTLCREFFWPGIDLSECLQYPDFSCVVLYRKFVIGFAFMVPDTKYNEAYISFIFTHPEWRGAGIGTFMLYHLIQTCMGKDVTLHVSASNPAMMLYQKFGFKTEEFILDFYEKYFSEDAKDSRHAFFLRLSR